MEKKFSLITPTLGRKIELIEMIESLNLCEKSELITLIVIDQNPLEFGLKKQILDIVSKMKIIYLHSKKKGLSHNRNLALKKIDLNEFVLFTDDDNTFDVSFFENILKYDSSLEEWDAIIANALNYEDKLPYTYPINQNKSSQLSFISYKKIISWNIVVKSTKIQSMGIFDESFGVGAKYGACEESDFIMRLLSNKDSRVFSCPESKVFHKQRSKNYYNYDRNKKYALGFGAFYRKQLKLYSGKIYFYFIIDFIRIIILSLGGLFLNLFNQKLRKHYIMSLKYKIIGFFSYK